MLEVVDVAKIWLFCLAKIRFHPKLKQNVLSVNGNPVISDMFFPSI